ncbi:nucleotidyltransferase domain-containing protein [Neobacillus vireti]|uniref:nucleotidyltransferase domain-containing protein n=1 Tax=Neobacillus vireti TaxID=220686 RepID=UPI003000B54B
MDVKYIPSDWEKMRDGIGDLIGLWRWGKGMIDNLKDISGNLEDAKSDIADYDHDGVISFQYTSLENKYQDLYEDFDILYSFTGKVGDIVDRTIDQPFYEDMDAFVEAMRDLTISNYTTKNRIGATETQIIYTGEYGPQQSLEVPKKEVSLDDLFSGGDFYGEQMKLEYEAWKELNPDKDISQEEYQQAALNTRAFEYESIRNQQENKEFWVQLGALVVIVGVSIVCPPAGIALGVAYGTLELSSAVSGKDWVSGRELSTEERWFRGLLAPLDIIPGAAALKKFTGTVNLSDNIIQMGTSTGIKKGIQQGKSQVDTIDNIGNAADLERGLEIPQGLTQDQFEKVSFMIKDKVGHISDDIVVQGSRAKGTARPTSDIDIAIRVPEEKFDELIQSSFCKVKQPNPGSAKEKTMLHAIKTGKIQSGEAKLSKFRELLQEELGMDVDISIIKIDGEFDNPPFTPLK